eukprot:17555-Prorocentrum_lima.AAC.1
MEELEVLRMSTNWLRKPMSFTGACRNLRILELRTCGLEAVGDTVRHLQSLEHLDLEDNKLASLPDAMSRLHRLKTLNL